MDADGNSPGSTIVEAEGYSHVRMMAESRIPRPRRGRRAATPADTRTVDWARVYGDFLAPMLAVAGWRLARARATDVEAFDVVHEVFADVIADPPEDMHNWGPLLLNATDRRAQRRVEQGDRDRDLFEDPEEDVASIALRRLHADETRRRLVRVMGYMTELQREVTHLRLFEGRTSSSNISQIVIRCLTKLQPGLVQLDDIDDGDMANLRSPRRLR